MTKDKIKLFIVDQDSIFRLGLRTGISQYADFAIVGEGNVSNDTFRELTQGIVLNILVLGITVDSSGKEIASLEFCQHLSQLYPELPIFLLTTTNFPAKKLSRIKSWGVKGNCDRNSSMSTVIEGLYSVAYGNSYWQADKDRPQPSFWQVGLSRLSKPGRLQMEETIQRIDTQLSNRDLSDWERVFLVGRKRELLAARWISNRLVNEELLLIENNSEDNQENSSGKLVPTTPTELTPLPVFADSANKTIFERVVTEIQLGLVNRTNVPWEIDILQPEVQKSLCHLILKRLSDTVEQIPIANSLDGDYLEYLQALWSWGIDQFFRQHYGQLTVAEEEELKSITERDFITVNNNIFYYIYGVQELFAYLLGKPGLTLDNVNYKSDDPEAIAHIEFLLQNLIIRLANAVMQVILNNFYDLEIFKYKLYQAEYKSDRALARFRNQLSWRYRQEKYFDHPQNIFESRHCLLILQGGKIRTFYVYASRRAELEQLRGVPWLTTMAIETRDAIAPIVRKFIALAGSGVVFVLTQVIGKGLGLIGKGIIQGIGSTIKDIPQSKKRD